ncbi:MAG TPA: FixH family protein [Bacteroidia bacterium]|nr:FixH family protein [Bacteroidia bacterium]
MSWGTKIAFLYVSFAGMIAFMVYKSATQNVDLVAPNYYEQELKYQDKIDGINNLNTNVAALKISQVKTDVLFSFDKELGEPQGHILFFKPDNAASDFEIDIDVNEIGSQNIDTKPLSKGTYIVKVDWKIGDKKFFKEQRLSIN